MNLTQFKAQSMDAVREISMAIQHLEQISEIPEGTPPSILSSDYYDAKVAIEKAHGILWRLQGDIDSAREGMQFPTPVVPNP